jgi:hypothetical protein
MDWEEATDLTTDMVQITAITESQDEVIMAITEPQDKLITATMAVITDQTVAIMVTTELIESAVFELESPTSKLIMNRAPVA